MNRINYQKELDKVIEQIKKEGKPRRLLLHACCAPCSSYCIEYLSEYFDITVFYYNPNIYPSEEYDKRVAEIKKFINSIRVKNKLELVEGKYDPGSFYEAVKGLENEPEGGARCEKCFRLRLNEAAIAAKKYNCQMFTTTLTISPLKDAQLLNRLGQEIGKREGVEYLFSDFKKRNGFKRSIELSAEYDLYRQNYCGCIFSKRSDPAANEVYFDK